MTKSTLILTCILLSFYLGFPQTKNFTEKTNLDRKNNDPTTIDVTTIPGYSTKNWYFHEGDLDNFFQLGARGFSFYQGGPGDTYIWDSVQRYHCIYMVYFTNRGFQETINPTPGIMDIQFPYHIKLLTSIGILKGNYDLAFDFDHNEKTKMAPREDIGSW